VQIMIEQVWRLDVFTTLAKRSHIQIKPQHREGLDAE
jgi:hypothetical protein